MTPSTIKEKSNLSQYTDESAIYPNNILLESNKRLIKYKNKSAGSVILNYYKSLDSIKFS